MANEKNLHEGQFESGEGSVPRTLPSYLIHAVPSSPASTAATISQFDVCEGATKSNGIPFMTDASDMAGVGVQKPDPPTEPVTDVPCNTDPPHAGEILTPSWREVRKDHPPPGTPFAHFSRWTKRY